MSRIYTAEEMRQAEQRAVDRGSSFEQLMENAGQAAAKDLLNRLNDGLLSRPQAVLIICGKGNNAGDGLVIARVLAEHGIDIKLSFLLGTELSPLAMLNLQKLAPLQDKITVLRHQAIDRELSGKLDDHWIIDGVFGTGYSGDLPEVVANVMAWANQTKAYRIALDLPSGLNCDSDELAQNTFNADLSYSFAAYKPAHFMPHGKTVCGEIICLDIGI